MCSGYENLRDVAPPVRREKPPRMLNQRKKEGGALIAKILGVIVFSVLLCIVFLDFYIADRYYLVDVSGNSMETTIHDGDTLYAARRFTLKRGDIVIVDVSDYEDYNQGGEHNIIKRLIATEGDRIKCEDGVVYLAVGGGDYAPLAEPYLDTVNDYEFEYEIGEGEIFVMGDNRPVSKDSRRTGPFLAEDVIGVVPDWSVRIKPFIGFWERVRESFSLRFLLG